MGWRCTVCPVALIDSVVSGSKLDSGRKGRIVDAMEQPVLVGDSIGARAGWDRPAAASDAISRVRIVLRNDAMASLGRG